MKMPTDKIKGEIVNGDKLIEWLDDLEPRAFYDADMIRELSQFGIEVDFVPTTSDHSSDYYSVAHDGNVHKIYVNSWDDDFQALIYRGLPFFVIDEDHVGPPEHHETKMAGYAIVSPNDVDMNQLAMLGSGYIYKNKEALEQRTVVGGSIFRALAAIIAGSTPGDSFHGRGFAANANLDAIKNAIGGEN